MPEGFIHRAVLIRFGKPNLKRWMRFANIVKHSPQPSRFGIHTKGMGRFHSGRNYMVEVVGECSPLRCPFGFEMVKMSGHQVVGA